MVCSDNAMDICVGKRIGGINSIKSQINRLLRLGGELWDLKEMKQIKSLY